VTAHRMLAWLYLEPEGWRISNGTAGGGVRWLAARTMNLDSLGVAQARVGKTNEALQILGPTGGTPAAGARQTICDRHGPTRAGERRCGARLAGAGVGEQAGGLAYLELQSTMEKPPLAPSLQTFPEDELF